MSFNCINERCVPCPFLYDGEDVGISPERATELAEIAEELKQSSTRHPNDPGLARDVKERLGIPAETTNSEEFQLVRSAVRTALYGRPGVSWCQAPHNLNNTER
jgi:hypothetical protein